MIGYTQVYRPGIGIVATAPLGSPIELLQGDVLRVDVSFQYKVAQESSCTLVGVIGLMDAPAAMGKASISLPPVADFTVRFATVDIPTGAGGWFRTATPPGIYNLLVWIEEAPHIYDEIPNAVIVAEKPSLIASIMSPMMMIMMMGMMIPLVSEGMEQR